LKSEDNDKDKDLVIEDKDKDLQINPRGQGLSSRTTTLAFTGDECWHALRIVPQAIDFHHISGQPASFMHDSKIYE